jgi:hydrogenase maturation protein HypF
MQLKLTIDGKVQGVGFRPMVYRIALKYGLRGYVKNTSQGVEIVVDGSQKALEKFVSALCLAVNKHPLASITTMKKEYGEFGTFKRFSVVKSSVAGETTLSITPDVGICEECVNEMFNEADRRYAYWFITCTNCGPRFSMCISMPYDRRTTSMHRFEMCKECKEEYNDPANRRYHAQTIACRNCGPKLWLEDTKGNIIASEDDAVAHTAELLLEGKIIAIKGIGGFHLCCDAYNEHAVTTLRKRRSRPNKPFAVMVASLKMAREFARVSEKERKLLQAWQRPIVLLNKKQTSMLAPGVAPGLHNVGVMLPYTGLHHLLFKLVRKPLVMTSANMPGEPTIIKNEDARKKLGEVADGILLHNRDIINRCDDSVIRIIENKPAFLRKSRGYVLDEMQLNAFKHETRTILGIGAEEGNQFCIINKGKIYLSPYTGDLENLEAQHGLVGALHNIMRLLDIESFDIVACDAHPSFNSSRIGTEIAHKHGAEIIKVQHHFAHAASCLAELNVDHSVCIVCDGFGYGLDGKAWGGEVIVKARNFERAAHLEEQLLVGMDAATRQPARIAAAVLAKEWGMEKIGKALANIVRERELNVWLAQIEQRFNVIESSSCGRVLDACAALLGICTERTYEGEPAMKLESVALNANKAAELPIEFKKHAKKRVLLTTPLIEEAARLKLKGVRRAEIALGIHKALAYGLTELALKCKAEYYEQICFSGGVAYNQLFHKFIKERLKDTNVKLYSNTHVPAGDGGVCLGQIYYAAQHMRG